MPDAPPPVLEYSDHAPYRAGVRWPPRASHVAAVIFGLCAATGLVLHWRRFDGDSRVIFGLFSLLAATVYCIARIWESRSHGVLKAVKTFSVLVAMCYTPAVFCRSPSLLARARVYGWNSDEALLSDVVVLLVTSVIVFAVAHAADRLIRWHRSGSRVRVDGNSLRACVYPR